MVEESANGLVLPRLAAAAQDEAHGTLGKSEHLLDLPLPGGDTRIHAKGVLSLCVPDLLS